MKYQLIVSLSLGAVAPALSGIFDIFQANSANSATHAVIEDPHPIRGLPDHLIPNYQQEHFVCDNGQTVLKPSSVNDGFCDCADQTDEPGTSACSRGTFHCRNKGYKLLAIPSSRVDDGICDCCDGTDEVGTTVCANTCKLAADRERAALDHMLTAYKSGRAQRQQLVQQVKQQLETQAAQYPHLQREMDSVRNQQTAVQKSIDERTTALNQERQGALDTNKATIDSLLLLEPSSVAYMAHFVYNLCDVLDLSRDQVNDLLSFQPPVTESNSDTPQDEAYTTEEGDAIEDVEFPIVGNEQECDITDITSSPLLSSLCASPQGSLAELHHVFFQLLKTYRPYSEVFFLLGHYRLQQQQWLDTATDFARNALLSAPASADTVSAVGGTCPEEFATLPVEFCTLKEDLQALLEPIVKSESHHNQDPVYQQLKQDLSNLQTSLRDLERRFADATTAHNSLQEKAEDTNLALQALKNQCFDVVDGKFSYSLCVLQRVSQREESGSHNTVTLGEYNSVSVANASDRGQKTQITMHFTNGQHCYNHGARKADVTLQCGATNRLLSASEPATCAYALVFETPVACTETFAQQEGLVPYL